MGLSLILGTVVLSAGIQREQHILTSMNLNKNRNSPSHFASTYRPIQSESPEIAVEPEEGIQSYYSDSATSPSTEDDSGITSVPSYTSSTLAFNAIEKNRFTWADIAYSVRFVSLLFFLD